VWGQTGSRPAAPKDLGFASAYVFGAVCPSQGKAAALIVPICNTTAMNHHLSEISSQIAADAHAVVILDRAGWHRSHALVVPDNITLLELPPYSPELNPVERVWHYLRSHWLANSVFISLADIMDACEMAWKPVRHQPRSDPLALRGRLGSGFSRSLDATYCPRSNTSSGASSTTGRPGTRARTTPDSTKIMAGGIFSRTARTATAVAAESSKTKI